LTEEGILKKEHFGSFTEDVVGMHKRMAKNKFVLRM
jgi:hypothetical protein